MINESRMLQDFLEYIQIPCHTLNERQIADLLTKQLTELGFDVKEDMAGKKLGGNTGNLIATRKGTVSTAPTLMLTSAPGYGLLEPLCTTTVGGRGG